MMLRTMLKATLQMSTAAPMGSNRLSTRGSISGVFDPFNTNLRRNSNVARHSRRSAVNQLLGRPPAQRSTKRADCGDLCDMEGGKRHGKVCFACRGDDKFSMVQNRMLYRIWIDLQIKFRRKEI